jgi:hypothetical protein
LNSSSTYAKENLEGSLTVLSVIREISNKVTDLVRNICNKLGLDPEIKVLISLKSFEERDIEGTGEVKVIICGYYDPNKRLIVISLPCVINQGTFAETLAHELVHHCQFTCRAKACKEICTISLNPEEAKEIREMLPYTIRPHEVEAYNNEERVASRIRNLEEFKNIEDLIKKLHNTLNYKWSGSAYTSKSLMVATSLIAGDLSRGDIAASVASFYNNTILKLLNCLKSKGLTTGSTLPMENIEKLLENIHTKFLALVPEKESLNGVEIRGEAIYIVTDRGFAIYTIGKNESLYPLLIIPTESISLKDALSGAISLNLKYEHVAKGYTELTLSSGKKVKSRVIIDTSDEFMKKLRELCGSIEYLNLAELGILITLCPDEELRHSWIKDLNNYVFKDICNVEIGGFAICNNVKIAGIQRGVRIKELFEELKRCEF